MKQKKIFTSLDEWKRYYFPKQYKKERALKLLKLPKEYVTYISDSLVNMVLNLFGH